MRSVGPYAILIIKLKCHRSWYVTHLETIRFSDPVITPFQEVMRSLDVRPRQLSRVTGMNYETIRSIAKKLP